MALRTHKTDDKEIQLDSALDKVNYYHDTAKTLLAFPPDIANVRNDTHFSCNVTDEILNFLRTCNDSREFATDYGTLDDLAKLIKRRNLKQMTHVFATAVARNSFGICEYLLRRGADVNDCLPTSEPALFCALRLNSFNKTALIFDYKPDMNVKYLGATPLEYALAMECDTKILELLSPKVSMKKRPHYSETPLDFSKRLRIQSEKRDIYFMGKESLRTTSKSQTNRNPATRRPGQANPSTKLIYTVDIDDSSMARVVLAIRDVEPQQKKRSPNTTVQLVRNCRDRFEEKLSEVSNIKRSFFSFLDAVSSKMSQGSVFDFEPVLFGSSAEETRCFFRDGFDIICWLKRTEDFEIYDTVDNLFRVKVPVESEWQKYCDESVIEQGKLLSDFRNQLFRALEIIKSKNLEFDRLRLSQRVLYHKIPSICLMWMSPNFGDIALRVNLIPSFRLPCELSKQLPGTQHYIVPIRDRLCYEQVVFDFKLSCSGLENGVMENLPVNIKQGFIYAKAMRFTNVCLYPKPADLSEFGLQETVYTEHLLSSHLLLSCLLSTIPKHTKFIDKICPEACARDVFIELAEVLEHRNVELWDGTSHLLCQKDITGQRGCCKKRNFTLTLVRNIVSSFNQTFSFFPSEISDIPVVRARKYKHKIKHKALGRTSPEQDSDVEGDHTKDCTTKSNRSPTKKRTRALEDTIGNADDHCYPHSVNTGQKKVEISAEHWAKDINTATDLNDQFVSNLAKIELDGNRKSTEPICAEETMFEANTNQNEIDSDQEASLTLDDFANINQHDVHQKNLVERDVSRRMPVVSISTAESGDTSDRSTDFFQPRDVPSADDIYV